MADKTGNSKQSASLWYSYIKKRWQWKRYTLYSLFSVDKGKFIRVMVFVIFLVNWGTQFCPYFFFKIQLLYMARIANSWCLPKKVVSPVGSFGNVKWNMLNRWPCSKQSSSCLKWQVTIGFSNESKFLRNICTYVKLSIGKKSFPFFLLVKRAFD